MDLKTYLATAGRGGCSALSEAMGISMSYLSQLASGKAAISPTRCVEFERLTNGAVTRQDLRPDDWSLIWPELIEKVNS